jgi:WD40 repeat protein
MKYVTSSRDGYVKVWLAHNLQWHQEIKVTENIWVTCCHYMTFTKRLVAASANRMISFYDLDNTAYQTPISRIEGLVGIPLCLEYYRWGSKNNDGKVETLLVGDDLGICHMWNFTQADWHSCQYKIGSKVPALDCHKKDIMRNFDNEVEKEFEADLKMKKDNRKKVKAKAKAGGNDDEINKMFEENAKTRPRKKQITF